MDELELARYKKLLREDDDLIDHLMEKSNSTQWYYERFLYFLNCAGNTCKYADACVKLMKEDIDEFYRGKQANNAT
jgi:hypothetical protein